VKYSLIIPVYNRPDEVDELLTSLEGQTLGDFEVVIVEDGSSRDCREQVGRHANRLVCRYYAKENSGPGPSRNYGAERAEGEYYIVLDSDVVMPEGYLAAVDKALEETPCDAFGGPDRAHPDFTPTQKAINYAMTAFLTTGGIRGGKKQMEKFHPRSFNMGVRASVWKKLGGFSPMRFGEDIDFSMRLFESGARVRLIPEAWVWHKRRTDFKKFFRQVHNSGMARIHLTRRHPGSLKLVHLLPAVFTTGVAMLSLLFLVGLVFTALGLYVGFFGGNGCNMGLIVAFIGGGIMTVALLPLLIYATALFIDSAVQNRSVRVGLLSVPASFIQLTGYGSGFIRAWWRHYVMRREDEKTAFNKNFYA
jgi:GT2 family glycosyltransferase